MVKGKYFNKSLFDIWRLKSNTYHQAFKDIFFKRFIKTFSLLSQFFFFPTSQRVEDRNEETEKESAAQFSGIIKVQSTFFLAPLLTYEKHSHSSVTQFFFFFLTERTYTQPPRHCFESLWKFGAAVRLSVSLWDLLIQWMIS